MHVASSKTKMTTADPREFIQLLMENERRIYAYIRSMLGNSADAEDVLQETSTFSGTNSTISTKPTGISSLGLSK